jgi:mannose-6-phosphate isomerase
MINPFKLEPTYRDYVWGGNRLRPGVEVTAEAWVVYEQNTIQSGPFAGKTLADAARVEGESLLGTSAVAQTGSRFPLLIKLLDCARWLSLQVHPNDEQARRLEGPGHFGKTEAWYIIEADEGAQLLSGFKPGVTRNQVRDAVGKKDILDLVVRREVKAGDHLLMTPGTIHAIGPGLLIYEVQQTSDITYRVYDWDRPVTRQRQLHIEQAVEVLDPEGHGEVRPGYPEAAQFGRQNMVSCQYFSLDLLSGKNGSIPMDTTGTSFAAITVLEGSATLQGDRWSETLNRYETLLIPASCRVFSICLNTPVRALYARVPP